MNDTAYIVRAKHKNEKYQIGWITGYLLKVDGEYLVAVNESMNMYDVDETTICRCTGIEDMHHQMMFENDIVNCPEIAEWEENEQYIAKVVWKDGMWLLEETMPDGVKVTDCKLHEEQNKIEVIGNTIENEGLYGR